MSAWVGWRCTRCRHEMRGRAPRFCSCCAYTVYEPIRDVERPEWVPDDRGRIAAALHTMSTSCWCQPATPCDGHVNEDGSQPEFAATDHDPVDADGFLIEELAR